ncbi:MAG: hypothetical protein WCS34_00670 [Bacteroidales bacterium]
MSSTLCYHTHIVNGVKIVHSHPFPNANHSNSSSTLQLIHHLSHVVLLIVVVFSFKKIVRFIYDSIIQENNYVHSRSFQRSLSLRGPPM